MKHNINEMLRTSFANSGRAAGAGISYDRYDDESGNSDLFRDYSGPVKFPSDSLTPEQRESLNGKVIIVQKGTKSQHER